MMSGRRVERFREGWALPAFTWGKAHYYKRDGLDLAVPACGGKPRPAGALFHEGNWQRCKRCEKALATP